MDLDELARQLEGYSGDDCSNFCRGAATIVVRRMMAGKSREEIKAMESRDMDPMTMDDFLQVQSWPPSLATCARWDPHLVNLSKTKS